MEQLDIQRLLRMKEYCLEIHDTIERYGNSFETFDADRDYQRSIAFSVLQIGELANGLTEAFRRETKAVIPWHAVRGMRNVVVHDYGSIDRRVLWDTAVTDIPRIIRLCERYIDEAKRLWGGV